MTYATRQSDFEDRIDISRMRSYRQGRTEEMMEKHDLDALLLFDAANVRYTTIGPSDMTFASGEPGLRYALYPIDEEPVLFMGGMQEGLFQRENPWLDIRPAIPALGPYEHGLIFNEQALNRQHEKLVEQIQSVLEEKGISGGTIGLDAMPSQIVLDKLKDTVNISSKGREAMIEARMIKNRDEVECLRIAASIVDGCFSEMKRKIRAGVTENEVVAAIFKKAYEMDAEGMRVHVDSGPHTWPNMSFHTNRSIRPGDLIYSDISNLSYMGYRTCYYRTFSCGKPTEAQKETYADVRDWLRDSIDAIKPGATTEDVVAEWPRAEEFGRPDEDAAILMQWGHGIGLSLYEPLHMSHVWSNEFPEEIQEGMTFALETIGPTGEKSPAYPDGQGVRLEDMVHVTSNGAEILTQWPIDEITVCEP